MENNNNTSEKIHESETEKVTVTVNDHGDTLRTDREVVFIKDRLLEIENFRLRAQIDSLMFASRRIEYQEVPIEVERPLTWWERFRLKSFWYGVGIILLSYIFIFRGVLIRLFKRLVN